MPIHDQSDDNGTKLFKILKLHEAPKFVKDASHKDIYGEEGMPLHLYADPANRKFPCHTAAATYVSTGFYLNDRDHLPEKLAEWIDTRLQTSASKLDIASEVHALREKFASLDDPFNERLPDHKFAVVLKRADGKHERHYPLRNKNEIKAAAEYLFSQRDVIPYDSRVKMAENILREATSASTDFECKDTYAFLERQSGRTGVCTVKEAVELINSRTKAIGRTDSLNDTQTELHKMASLCNTQQESDAVAWEFARKGLASVIDAVDTAFQLKEAYGSTLDRPEDVLFGITTKQAHSLLSAHVELQTGNIYKRSDLSRANIDDIRDVLGDQFAEEIMDGGLLISKEKFANQAAILPRADAELLETLLRNSNIKPVYTTNHKQSSVHEETWQNLAELCDSV